MSLHLTGGSGTGQPANHQEALPRRRREATIPRGGLTRHGHRSPARAALDSTMPRRTARGSRGRGSISAWTSSHVPLGETPQARAARALRGHAGLPGGRGRARADAAAAVAAGADRRGGRLARAARPAEATSTLTVRARDPSGADAGEHPGRALPPHQALCGHRAGSEGAALAAARLDHAGRRHARHPGPGRDRPGAGAQGRGPRDARDRHAAAPGADAPRGARVRAGRHRHRAGRLRLRAAAAAGDAGHPRLHERGAAQAR